MTLLMEGVLGASNAVSSNKEKVREALNRMLARKAPGLDGIASERLKRGGVMVVEWFVRLPNPCFV